LDHVREIRQGMNAFVNGVGYGALAIQFGRRAPQGHRGFHEIADDLDALVVIRFVFHLLLPELKRPLFDFQVIVPELHGILPGPRKTAPFNTENNAE